MLPAAYTSCKCLVLGYHMAAIPALCLTRNKQLKAWECEPPACLNPAELRKSCGCASTTGPHPSFAAGWGLSATEVLWLGTAQLPRHSSQDAGTHLPCFSSDSCMQPLAHPSLHVSCLLLGHTAHVFLFHTVCR